MKKSLPYLISFWVFYFFNFSAPFQAFCSSPFCAPSRASLLTGRRPQTTKVFDAGQKSFRIESGNEDLVTLPGYFKHNGYKTYSFGKVRSKWDAKTSQSLSLYGYLTGHAFVSMHQSIFLLGLSQHEGLSWGVSILERGPSHWSWKLWDSRIQETRLQRIDQPRNSKAATGGFRSSRSGNGKASSLGRSKFGPAFLPRHRLQVKFGPFPNSYKSRLIMFCIFWRSLVTHVFEAN